ncbi:MAG: rhomboid family intramembrane serine protease [Kangiellaceae bacterium]|nr:rhomboid family intramembrane serine protease [Kangiellaceae bacterium]
MKFNSKSVIILVGLNAIIFLIGYRILPNYHESFALFFPENDNFASYQFVSYLFLHGSFSHVIFNMFALYSFGSVLESSWGTKRFLIFYFITGVGAAVVYTMVNYFQYFEILDQLVKLGLSDIDIKRMLASGSVQQSVLSSISEAQLMEFYSIFHTPAVGASGAIYGILIAYAISYPEAKLALIFLPIPIKAKYFVPILITGDLFFGVTKYSIGNIAHFAHIGGAVFGLLMMLWWSHRKDKASKFTDC